ncbi:DUF3618 domain-containing protein [Roseomonas sp. E05]|uniref:DUF3618 domain-containing protein n=1 Tax=Roseomonas sp. E05 TaxID=3046310 RepID=UPI0024B88F4C|nr:DUF3618 domain-containing protein [Roseomonas sp. E05]MDJ0388459.1 DUF3618 domain-containing protein [Roseomonas sp. E05]
MSETTNPNGQSPAEIEEDVERTRARVTDTIEALRERMSPGQVMDQLMDYARESGGPELMRNLGASVRDNPLPLLLVGAGLGWMMLSSGRRPVTYPATRAPDPHQALLPPPPSGSSAPGLGTRAGEAARHAGERTQGMMGGMRDHASSGAGSVRDTASSTYAAGAGMASRTAGAVSDAASRTGATASDLANQASEGLSSARRAATASYHDASDSMARGYGAASARAGMLADRTRGSMTHITQEQPLLFGALGLALGAALGALLPRTETEDRLMGEASDAAADRATAAVQQGYTQAKETATEHLERGKEKLEETYAHSQDELRKGDLSAQKVADVVSGAAAEVKKTATDTAHGMKEEAKNGVGTSGSKAGAESSGGDKAETKPAATSPQAGAATTPSSGSVSPRPTAPPF